MCYFLLLFQCLKWLTLSAEIKARTFISLFDTVLYCTWILFSRQSEVKLSVFLHQDSISFSVRHVGLFCVLYIVGCVKQSRFLSDSTRSDPPTLFWTQKSISPSGLLSRIAFLLWNREEHTICPMKRNSLPIIQSCNYRRLRLHFHQVLVPKPTWQLFDIIFYAERHFYVLFIISVSKLIFMFF